MFFLYLHFLKVHVGGYTELRALIDEPIRLKALLDLVQTTAAPFTAPTIPAKGERASVLASLAEIVACEEDK